MQKNCRQCAQKFEITPEDLSFYDKISPVFKGKKYPLPAPTLCSACRFQRRLSWRNEKTLYNRTCDLCKKDMIAIFPADTPYKVYCQDCWWSDKWDPMEFGRDFDFNRPFFSQFSDLLKDVPFYGLVNQAQSLENSEYVNYMTDAKNCYLVFAANYLQDCMYSSYIWQSRDALDSMYSTKMELCYFCLDCDEIYQCMHLQNCRGCSDCVLGFELRNCRNCFGCVNLNNKEYHFFNKPLDKEEYTKKVREILGDRKRFEETKKEYKSFLLQFPKRYAHQINCENAAGDGIKNCKNAMDCYDGYGGQDIKWMINFPGEVKDCYDISGCAKLERAIDSHAIFPGYEVRYSNSCLNGGSNINWCAFTDGGKDCFGCVGIRKSEYTILNKRYNQEEYEDLVARIIEHMKKNGEYGEFFPIRISPFAYNETVAQEYFPMAKKEVLNKMYRWKEVEIKQSYKKPVDIPDTIGMTSDTITNELLTCVECNKQYRIIPKELGFYRKMNIAVPRTCPACRQKSLLGLRNPRRLWDRACAKCGDGIRTTYSPQSPEIVYCEKCYLGTVY